MKIRTLPFGYHLTQCTIAPQPAESDTVQWIYQQYICGVSYSGILEQLNRKSIQYRPGATWNKHMVKRILEDGRYLGERGYPAIISADDFEAVAARKSDNPHCRPKLRKPKEDDAPLRLLPYEFTAKALRLSNEINRALERRPNAEIVRPMIFACAAEKYKSLMYVPEVESHE